MTRLWRSSWRRKGVMLMTVHVEDVESEPIEVI
jgi:hypothetical protein